MFLPSRTCDMKMLCKSVHLYEVLFLKDAEEETGTVAAVTSVCWQQRSVFDLSTLLKPLNVTCLVW